MAPPDSHKNTAFRFVSEQARNKPWPCAKNAFRDNHTVSNGHFVFAPILDTYAMHFYLYTIPIYCDVFLSVCYVFCLFDRVLFVSLLAAIQSKHFDIYKL